MWFNEKLNIINYEQEQGHGAWLGLGQGLDVEPLMCPEHTHEYPCDPGPLT